MNDRLDWLTLFFIAPALLAFITPAAADDSSETRAVRFLSREVAAWSFQNKCFSCHNNGDGARALYHAAQKGYLLAPETLKATEDWLLRPAAWERDAGSAEFKDARLARIQFATTLLELVESIRSAGDAHRLRPAQAALRQAAERLAEDQADAGHWPLVTGGTVAAPATYGPILATHFACRVLQEANADRYAARRKRGQRWLEQVQLATVPDAAGVVWALAGVEGDAAAQQRDKALDLIRRAQSSDGGWGPYLVSPAEPYDTALALIAMSKTPQAELQPLIDQGRAYLLSRQQADGSWPATTRPAGVDSYAEYISTSAWAFEALLTTRPKR